MTELSFKDLLGLALRRWRLLLLVAVCGAAIGAIISSPLVMKPRFRSTAIVYPANLNSYSVETRTDQLLQLLESNAVRDSVLLKFHLMEHWNIDTLKPTGRTLLHQEFMDRIDISKTRYESVQIEATDEDPITAKRIVDEMLKQVNLLARRLQREKSAELLTIAEHNIERARSKMDSAEAHLKSMRESQGLLVYESQTQELMRGYVRMLTRGGSTQAQKDEVRNMMRSLAQAGGEFRGLTDLADMYRQNYNQAQLDYEHAQVDMTKELTYTNVVISAEASDKKVWPVRWLVVLILTLSSALLALVVAAIVDHRR